MITVAVKSSMTASGDINGNESSGDDSIQVDQLFVSSPDNTVPVALEGTVSTRTSDTEGILTVTGHDITSSEGIAIFWDDGARYDVVISAVDADTITFSGGSGDVLPDAATEITVSTSISVNVGIDGDNIAILAAGGDTNQLYSYVDDVGDSVYTVEPSASKKSMWWTGIATNPLTGANLVSIKVYNKSTTSVASAVVWVGYNMGA